MAAELTDWNFLFGQAGEENPDSWKQIFCSTSPKPGESRLPVDIISTRFARSASAPLAELTATRQTIMQSATSRPKKRKVEMWVLLVRSMARLGFYAAPAKNQVHEQE